MQCQVIIIIIIIIEYWVSYVTIYGLLDWSSIPEESMDFL
jgi:hypothetical protein